MGTGYTIYDKVHCWAMPNIRKKYYCMVSKDLIHLRHFVDADNIQLLESPGIHHHYNITKAG